MPGKPWTPEQRAAARQRYLERQAKKSESVEQEAAPDSPVTPQPPAPTLEEFRENMRLLDAGAERRLHETRTRIAELKLLDEERELLRVKAKQAIDEELHAKAKKEREKFLKDELDKEILRQRREAGLTDHQDDIIEFMINVAPFSPGVIINGKLYPHGSWQTMTRREYDSIRDIMARSWESEERAGNPNKKFEEWRRAAGVTNPMMRESRMTDGTYTLGLQYGVHGQNPTGRTTYNA